MKNLISFCIAFLMVFAVQHTLFGQDGNNSSIEITPTDQPYPIGNQPANGTVAAFISVFDDTNVGNLHVYATPTALSDQDYFYTGTDITGSFNEILPERLKRNLRRNGGKVYAVRNIRGVNGEYYILRMPRKNGGQELKMYELQGTKLVSMMTLASATCKKSGKCKQIDSWIQDIDGDTRLDIIQRTAKVNAGSTGNIKTKVYMQDRSGQFKLNNSADIEEQDYMLEKM